MLTLQETLYYKKVQNVLRIYGVTREEDTDTSLSALNNEQVKAQILNWIMWCIEFDKPVEIRISDNNEQTVYAVALAKTHHRGMQVQNFKNVPELFGKLLYHWNTEITYERLSVEEIAKSIENADI